MSIVEYGWLEIEIVEEDGNVICKKIGIIRLYMEEDVGKLVYGGSDCLFGLIYLMVDYNCVGVLLIEIVLELDICFGIEVVEYV